MFLEKMLNNNKEVSIHKDKKSDLQIKISHNKISAKGIEIKISNKAFLNSNNSNSNKAFKNFLSNNKVASVVVKNLVNKKATTNNKVNWWAVAVCALIFWTVVAIEEIVAKTGTNTVQRAILNSNTQMIFQMGKSKILSVGSKKLLANSSSAKNWTSFHWTLVQTNLILLNHHRKDVYSLVWNL